MVRHLRQLLSKTPLAWLLLWRLSSVGNAYASVGPTPSEFLPPVRRVDVSLREDNDGMGFHTNGTRVSDNYYTQGLEFRARWFPLPTLGVTAGIAQRIFTPSNITRSNLTKLEGDQPNAGWLYGLVGIEHWVGRWSLGAELDVGVIGPDAQGGRAQVAWHQFLRWTFSSQSPPNPAALGTYEIANRPGIELSLSAVNTFANLTRYTGRSGREAGLRLLWTAQVDAGSIYGAVRGGGGIQLGLFGAPPASPPRVASELYLFAQMELMGVGWNQLVTGPLVSGAPNTTQLQHVVPVGRFGLVARYRHAGLFFGQVTHRQLITSLPAGEETWHHYGQAELNWAW